MGVNMKLCKDCDYVRHNMIVGNHTCRHPKNLKLDVVTGDYIWILDIYKFREESCKGEYFREKGGN